MNLKELNWIVVVIIGVVVIGLLILIYKRNRKDLKEFKDKVSEDYQKPREHNEEL